MKRAVSVSLGSSKRDKAVEVKLLDEMVSIERIGTDGDMEAAALKYKELDGIVDAFGVGGADLGVLVDKKWYPLYSVNPMVRFIKKTPVVDGTGLKTNLESKSAAFLDAHIKDYINERGRKAFIMTGVDRWGLASCFENAGYECIFGDLMFSLGIPIALHSTKSLKILAALLMPVAGRLPFAWIYPTGEKQEERKPKHVDKFHWATVTAGDCHYIKRYMPDDMQGKVIVTNTTTPVLEGRSFGTNMMESALIAISGKKRPLTDAEYSDLLAQLKFEPQIQELN